jgi:hypothetical protein
LGYIAVNSEALQDVLRWVLRDVPTTNVNEDKPRVSLQHIPTGRNVADGIKIEETLIYLYIPELKHVMAEMMPSPETETRRAHLRLLLDFMQETFRVVENRLGPLLKNDQISYRYLWALFKPNTIVFMTCPFTKVPTCFKCDCGYPQERSDGSKFYRVYSRFFDWDGKRIGESRMVIEIEEFPGVKPICELSAYPLKYHPEAEQMSAQQIENGRKFLTLNRIHHVEYRGLAMCMDRYGKPAGVPLRGRSMLDVACFRERNPRFPLALPLASRRGKGFDPDWFLHHPRDDLLPRDQVRKTDTGSELMSEEDLLICSHLLFGYSLSNRLWGKYSHLADLSMVANCYSWIRHLQYHGDSLES